MGDGLVAVAERAAAVKSGQAPSLQLLVVDASSGDATQVCRNHICYNYIYTRGARDQLVCRRAKQRRRVSQLTHVSGNVSLMMYRDCTSYDTFLEVYRTLHITLHTNIRRLH